MVQKVNLKMFAMTEVSIGRKGSDINDLLDDLWVPLIWFIHNIAQNLLMVYAGPVYPEKEIKIL